ncbi:MAG: ATP-binding protein [bacterium]
MKLTDFLHKLARPKATDEDLGLQEYILNVILLVSIFLSAGALFRIALDKNIFGGERFIYLAVGFVLFAIFIALYWLSRKGFFGMSSYVLIMAYFIPATYAILKFGADLTAGLLFYSLIIVMASILISVWFSLGLFLIISFAVIIIGCLQIKNALAIWKMRPLCPVDLVIYVSILGAVLAVSWLFNYETQKLLERARKSEENLKEEKGLLETKIEERTKEINRMQAEKIAKLYRCAEFGRLSSGIFHDLMNLLSVVSLNLVEVEGKNKEILNAKLYLQQALSATKRMENFLEAVNKQIRNEGTEMYFSVNKEIFQTIQIFSYKARKSWVEVIFKRTEDIKTYGDPIKFNQIVSNLISNAIDSYEKIDGNRRRQKVKIGVYEKDNFIHLVVRDWGCGVPDELRDKIFEPFFTTKEYGKGTGIGLFSTKSIIEKSFSGSIKLAGKEGNGMAFYISFPKRQISNEMA